MKLHWRRGAELATTGCALIALTAVVPATAALGAGAAGLLYQQHCAACHGADRLGGSGPALLPENLGRLRPATAEQAIRDGLSATGMPGFAASLTPDQVMQLAEYVFTPLPEVPAWGLDEISASRILHNDPASLGDRPDYQADPLNLFVVVEAGTHHVTILDGDRFEPIHRFKSRYALHGGAKFSPEGRFVYLASRDGWISKFDLYSLKPVVEIRAGINTRNLAVSGDGRYVAVGNILPHDIVILAARDLAPLKLIPVRDDAGHSSRVSAVYDAAPRRSFIAALKDVKEVWEISYADDPPFHGRVHDYRDEGAPAATEKFPARRMAVDDYFDDFFFDHDYEHLIGTAREAGNGQVVNLAVGRKIAELALSGLPHLGSGITWNLADGTPVLATPNLGEGSVTIIDMRDWRTLKRIETPGPGFFIRSHELSPYAWVDSSAGPQRDLIQVIDKQALAIVRTLRPEPGQTAAHVEFTRDGRHALVSIMEDRGAIVVYDARSLEEVKRLPMDRPSGKYNVFNKISGSSGTSH